MRYFLLGLAVVLAGGTAIWYQVQPPRLVRVEPNIFVDPVVSRYTEVRFVFSRPLDPASVLEKALVWEKVGRRVEGPRRLEKYLVVDWRRGYRELRVRVREDAPVREWVAYRIQVEGIRGKNGKPARPSGFTVEIFVVPVDRKPLHESEIRALLQKLYEGVPP